MEVWRSKAEKNFQASKGLMRQGSQLSVFYYLCTVVLNKKKIILEEFGESGKDGLWDGQVCKGFQGV